MDSSVLQRVKEKASSFQQKSKDWKHCGKWLRCGVIDYVDPAGNAREYETMERTTRTKLTGVDGVDVITLLNPPSGSSEGKKICLVIVYRPPVDRFSLGFPAGLVDEGERLEQAAQRELLEETGYTGDLKFLSPPVYLDPSTSNGNGSMCIAEVGAGQERTALKLDEDEYLECVELPVRDLRKQLDLIREQYGFIIDARLYCFAMGLEMGEQLSKN